MTPVGRSVSQSVGLSIVDASAASFTAILTISDEIGVRTTSASTDVEIVVVVDVAVVIDGETIVNSSAASFTAVVVASDKIGVRSTSTSTDVEIDIVVVVDGDNCRRLRRLFHHQLRSF